MSEDYEKLAKDIIYSSVWDEDAETCKVWITLLALKDYRTGIVSQNLTGISRIAKVEYEKCQQAIEKFESPDLRSSTATDDGRRLRRLPEGGWLVLNHEKYRQYGWSEEKKEYERERKARWRKGKAVKQTGSGSGSEAEGSEVTREMALGWWEQATAAGADYTEREVLDAWLYFVRSGWVERGTRVTDYRAALEEKIQRERRHKQERDQKRNTGNSKEEELRQRRKESEDALWNKKLT